MICLLLLISKDLVWSSTVCGMKSRILDAKMYGYDRPGKFA